MTTDEQFALIDELEGFANGGGYAYDSVTRRVRSIYLTLRLQRLPGFELTAVEESATILYSARRHTQLPGGLEGARVNILSDCAKLRRIAESRRLA